MYSIGLKLGICSIGHSRKNLIDFVDCRIYFFQEYNNISYILWPKECNYCMCASVSIVHSIELKFETLIIGHQPTKWINFSKFRINRSFL